MNRLRKSTTLLVAIYILFQSTTSLLAVNESQEVIFPDEDLIPFYVHMVDDFQSDVGKLRKGDRLVVLRPAGSDQLRINLSRAGTITIPAGVTDVAEQIDKAKRGEVANLKMVPRMSFFLANRVMSGESGWQDPVPGDRINSSQRWFLLYGDARESVTREAVRAASDYYDRLEQSERDQTVFVYMDIPGDKEAIQELADSMKPSIQCMPGYLSRGYAKSLDQIDLDKEMPQLVEVASSGRIKHRITGAQSVNSWLKSEIQHGHAMLFDVVRGPDSGVHPISAPDAY